MAVEITKTAKSVKRYGYLFPVGATDMSIELACYSLRANYPTEHSTEFHFRNAWKIMWPNFQWNQWAEMMVWAWCNYENIAVIGHSASGKSFLAAHCLLLDFIARPLETSTTVTTTKFDALRTRIWGDIMQAIETSAIKSLLQHLFKITTTSNELKVSIKDAGPEYINKRLDKDKFIIQGVATDGADVNASKLRGQHTNRRRIVADECEDMGAALYGAMTNARTAPDWKALLLTNPAERTGEFGGKWACPREGWGSVTENDLSWETVQPNGICLHFDGLQSPNIKAGSTIFPYLLTQKYIDEIRSVNGEDSLHWWMFVRGMPAPDGVVAKIWPSSTIAKVKQAAEFDFPPVPCASLDPAFGGDDCILLLAERGRLRTGQPYITVKQRIKIKVIEGPDRLLKEQQICDETIRACREWRVTPDNLIIDASGQGQGVLALLRTHFGQKVEALYYGGEATDRPLRMDDPKKASDQVKYFVTELWFRASYMANSGMMGGLHNLSSRAEEDLAARRYLVKDARMIAESKTELKKRIGHSPDEADAFCQLGELMIRRGMLGEYVIGGKRTSLPANGRMLARKAARRYAQEFHVAS